MPDTDTTSVPAQETDRAARQLNRSLRRLHLSRPDRRAITEDVRGDLETAAFEGVRPGDLLGPDVDAFARQAVERGGYEPLADDYPRLLVLSTVAAVVGLPAVYVLFSFVLQPLFDDWFTLDRHYPTAGPVLACVVMGLMATGVLLAVLYASLAGRPARIETVKRAALLVPVGLALSIAAVLAVTGRDGFTMSEASIYTQVLPAGALPLGVALASARWWGRRAGHRSASEGPAAPTAQP